MGRVCYRPCETACNRAQLDAAVGINSVERFLGDEAIRQGWTIPVTAPSSGKRVLVVGAGPSGLSAAYHLRLLGHEVTIRDSAPCARRDDALRHPGLPAAAPDAVRRDRPHPRHGRHAGIRPASDRHRGRDGRRPVRCCLPRRRRAERQARLHSGRRFSPHPGRRHAAAFDGGRTSNRNWDAVSRFTAVATQRWTRPGRRAALALPMRSSSTGVPGRKCQLTMSRSRRRPKRACG